MTDCCQDLQAASALAQQPDQESADAGERGDSVTKRRRSSSKTGGGAAVVVMVVDVTSSASKLRWRRSAAACLVLSILQRCFQYDRGGFVDKSRFDVLMPAIVSQLECGAGYLAASPESEFAATLSSGRDCVSVVDSTYDGEVSACRRHAEELVGPCLAMLAAASAKDALWKALVNAVLMKTRSGKVGVRVAALVSLRHCFEVVGEEFLALLPECLPFLSELLEVRDISCPLVEMKGMACFKFFSRALYQWQYSLGLDGILTASVFTHLCVCRRFPKKDPPYVSAQVPSEFLVMKLTILMIYFLTDLRISSARLNLFFSCMCTT